MRTTRSTTRAGVAALLVTAAAVAGCATTRESPAMPSPPMSSPPMPSPTMPGPAVPGPATGPAGESPAGSASSPARRATTPAESTAPPLSSTELPTGRPPGKPPKTPTDLVPPDVIAGRVTRGGSGPCYGLITDDGTEYAVYSAASRPLTEGTSVRIRFEPLRRKIDCGPGRPVQAVEITVLS